MSVPISKYVVRWRIKGSNQSWVTQDYPADVTTISIKGMERGNEYEIEAQSVGVNGATSQWVSVNQIIASNPKAVNLGDVAFEVSQITVTIDEHTQKLIEQQQVIDAEIADRLAGDLAAVQAAAQDATNKANAAAAAANARADALQAQMNDFTGQADEWVMGQAYPKGDFVKSGGKLYRAIQDAPGNIPLADTDYWTKLGEYSSAGDAIAKNLEWTETLANEQGAHTQRLNGLDSKNLTQDTEISQRATNAQLDTVRTTANAAKGLADTHTSQIATLQTSQQGNADSIAAHNNRLSEAETHINTLTGDVSGLSQTVQTQGVTLGGKADSSYVDQVKNTVDQQGGVIASHASNLQQINSTVFDAEHGVTAMGNAIDETRIDIATLKSPAANGVSDPYFQTSAWVEANGIGYRVEGYYGRALLLPAASGLKWWTHDVPVDAGRGYTLSGEIYRDNQGGAAFYNVEYLDAQKEHIAWGMSFGTSATSVWDRVSYYEVVPSGAVWKRIYCETYDTTGSSYFNKIANKDGHDDTFSDDSLVRASLSRVQSLEYEVNDPNGKVAKKASVTEVSAIRDDVNGLEASKTLKVRADDVITGFESKVSGGKSSFSILASVFRVISATTGLGMEWLDGYLRIWKGSAQLIIGHTFGANQDLIFYYGANVGASNASKANATIWFDTVGNAYFGGSLSAGTRKNAAQSTQQSATASVETGNFGTGGNAKVVVCSFSAGGSTATYTNTGNGTTSMSATVVLERSYGGGAWTQIGTFTANGQYVRTWDAGDAIMTHEANCSGSITVTDNTAGTSTFNYRARITSTNGSIPLTLPNGAYQQSLSVISTEQ